MTDFDPVHYRIQLSVDIDAFRFSGRTVVRMVPRRPSGEVTLNACDLTIREVTLLQPNGRTPCPFQVDPAQERLTIFLPECVSEEIQVQIDHEGSINNRMAGLYRSSFRQDGKTRWLAVTQFQESDARRVFPCMDHPARKATFAVELTVPANLTAVSNTPPGETVEGPDGRKTVRFETTPKMSTYLLFMGIGPFETRQDTVDRRLFALTTPGMTPYSDFALAFAREALGDCESYFAIPYPLAKLDLIAVPDFAFGAMENWGAITFRENLLLRYPDTTSRAGLERICEVTAHEIVHQWFGNLVTPADWRYLWLNESFATYFAYGVVDRFRPDWRIWERFIGGQTAEALERDGLIETFPIEIPGGEHVVINSSTAPIIYSKGASVLRQVEGFIGADAFKAGLRGYLSGHAYGSTHSRDLWKALEAASEAPVTRLMENWVGQPGYPLIEARREKNRLTFRQHRFSYLPGAPEATWIVPLKIRLFEAGGAQQTLTLALEDRQMAVDIDPDIETFKVNDGQSGFYRVSYGDEENLQSLGRLAAEKILAAPDRWGLAADMYALLKAGRIDLDRYLAFLKHFRDEDALLPLGQVAANLHRLMVLLPGEGRKRIQAFAAPFFRSRLLAIGLSPSKEDAHDRSILREQLLWPAAAAGVREVEDFGGEMFDNLLSGRPVDPEVFKGVLQIGAMTHGSKALSWFLYRMADSESEHERMAVLSAMGCFRQKAQVDAALQAVLDTIPDRNKFIPVVAMSANPAAVARLWPWYTANREKIEKFHPLLYERVVAALIPACGVKRPKEVADFFDDHLSRTPLAADAIRMALERLRIDTALRRRCADAA